MRLDDLTYTQLLRRRRKLERRLDDLQSLRIQPAEVAINLDRVEMLLESAIASTKWRMGFKPEFWAGGVR